MLVLIGFEAAYEPGGDGSFGDLKPFDMMSDKRRYERIRQVLVTAPQLGLGSATLGWARAASNSIVLINTPGFAESLTVPTVILAAGKDQRVSTRITERFAMRASAIHFQQLAESHHAILEERDEIRSQFWAAFDAHIGS